jgi:hypothetical protein
VPPCAAQGECAGCLQVCALAKAPRLWPKSVLSIERPLAAPQSNTTNDPPFARLVIVDGH